MTESDPQSNASRQTNSKMTLDQTLEEACLANPSLKLIEAQRPVAEAGIVQAKIRVNPFYQGEFAPAENTYRFYMITATTQLGLKRQRRIEVAKGLIDSTNATIRTMAWKIRQDTESAYFELAIAQQTLQVMEDYLETTKRLSATTQKRREARDASGLEVLRAEAAVADAKAQVVPVEVRVQQAMRQLNLILGRPPENPIEIMPPAFLSLRKSSARIPPFTTLISQAEKYRPEFRQNDADLSVQASRIKLARSFWWPDVQTTMGMSSVAQNANNDWFGSRLLNKPAWMLTMPIPINDHGQGILATAIAAYRQLQQQRIALVNQVRQEVNLTYSSAYATEQQMDILVNESLPKQARILSMSEIGYKNGVLDLTAAITAQQSALATRINFLQTATSYFQALVQLERAVGRPIISEMVQQGGK